MKSFVFCFIMLFTAMADAVQIFICPCGQSISTISSDHSNHHEDRHFNMSCKPTAASNPPCYVSNFVNNFDESFVFTCPENDVLAGIFSYHSNHYEDRRFAFYCCSATIQFSGCAWTPYLNNFDQTFSYHTLSDQYIAGMSAYHRDNYEDRRFRLYICQKQ
ncbi:hemagglutinin/amebocyte aggregation factor-like isoform X2 [Engraulis encrasicolus]|uniref:hemagglutinin/amebocyte aggregation factor-like isoform X2 n=1 Tax=Engraulis encrasicolus TaxID=184585 RepID=UPI002FD365CA